MINSATMMVAILNFVKHIISDMCDQIGYSAIHGLLELWNFLSVAIHQLQYISPFLAKCS